MRATIPAVVAVVAFVLQCGCGGDRASPKATYETMMRAARAGDRNAMQACFTAEKGSRPAGRGDVSEELLEAITRHGARIAAGEERITGDKATLELIVFDRAGRAQKPPLPLTFTREEGMWKIDRYVGLLR